MKKGGGTRERQIETLKKMMSYLNIEVSQERLDYAADNLWGSSGTFRKGRIGSWKESFDENNKELFKAVMGQELIELGYEQDNNW